MEKEVIQLIPNRLRMHRKRWRLKQYQAAAILGLQSANSLSQWEKGYAMPSAQHLIDLSNLYRTYPNELYVECFRESLERVRASEEKFLGQKRLSKGQNN